MTNPIQSHTLRDGETEITVLSVGCAIQNWQVAGRRVVLGYADPEDYRVNPKSMGIVVGRVANRIKGSTFELDGQVWELLSKDGRHHIHGGPGGLGWQNWVMQPEGDRAVTLRLHSPHLDQGYPGTVDFTVRLSLEGGALTWDMTALPDRVTPVNLAQHLYFNLMGTGDIREHVYQIGAARCTPTDADLVPTGDILEVAGTRYDFREPVALTKIDPNREGYDLNFALDGGDGPAAHVVAPDGMALTLWTDRPGLQLYTSNTLAPYGTPLPVGTHMPFGAFCMEAQDFPNALNTEGFGSILCGPDAPYRQTTTIRIAQG